MLLTVRLLDVLRVCLYRKGVLLELRDTLDLPKQLNRGRSVARHPAMMHTLGSRIDQMAKFLHY